jgi:hypothetical protein
VDTEAKLKDFVMISGKVPNYIADMFLTRRTTATEKISILAVIQITFASISCTAWVIDVTTLRAKLFSYVAKNGKSVKSILEDQKLLKSSAKRVRFDAFVHDRDQQAHKRELAAWLRIIW